MKRKFLLLNLVLVLFLVIGCTNNYYPDAKDNPKTDQVKDQEKDYIKNDKVTNSKDENNKDSDESKNEEVKDEGKLSISSYYPIKENTRYLYEGMGNEYATYDVYTAYTNKNKVQHRIDNGGTVVAEVVEIKDGEVVRLLSRGEAYYREDLLRDGILNNIDKKDKEVLLKEPLQKGNSWILNDGRKRTITNTAVDVTTLKKVYKAIEVTTEGPDKSRTMDYYAKDVGLVKSVFLSEGMEVKSELKNIEEDTKLTQKIKFFYADIDDERLHFKERDIDFKTNDITRKVLEENYKDILKDTRSVVLTENTKINYLYLNSDGMVYIDLSKDFLTEMNAGAGYEGQILKSVAATFGNYYNAQKVVITLDGKEYESGHILLEKGEYIEYNIDDAVDKS